MGDKSLKEEDMPALEKQMQDAVKENQPFQRIEVTREEALSMFEENKFKVI